MELEKIIIESEVIDHPPRAVKNRNTGEIEFTMPAMTRQKYYITYVYDDGTTSTVFTNRYGEGLFKKTPNGGIEQLKGTCDFVVKDSSVAETKQWFRYYFLQKLKLNAKIRFRLDYRQR